MIQSCDTPPIGSPLLTIKNAINKMLSQIESIDDTENVLLGETLGRVLAVGVRSNIDVPLADNSAMDGYAMAHQDLTHKNTLQMVGSALAGNPYNTTVLAGQCVRIMTGAIIPDGADAVIMQENTVVQ
ncbi:MAG: molybdopterin molybdenumtransferase MoeA, partial [Paraglaciecola sp.]|nr:molybdopterin molybdenumtransferase MoeA [Paraglaciecola sp.]